MTKPLLRAAVDVSWDQSLAMEEFAEGNCFLDRDARGRRGQDQGARSLSRPAPRAVGAGADARV
jgi:hypothetical protein